ncbi:MAG: hypothetical protein AB8C84_07480 [Oligoflexales bacterium]
MRRGIVWVMFLVGCEVPSLPEGKHRLLVEKHCTSCHSHAHLLVKKRSRAQWESVVSWMQKMNGMSPLGVEDHKNILDYLESL